MRISLSTSAVVEEHYSLHERHPFFGHGKALLEIHDALLASGEGQADLPSGKNVSILVPVGWRQNQNQIKTKKKERKEKGQNNIRKL